MDRHAPKKPLTKAKISLAATRRRIKSTEIALQDLVMKERKLLKEIAVMTDEQLPV
ncbi:hypothetical protein ACX80Z_04015 [Arthrobacter sp. TMT4-20]